LSDHPGVEVDLLGGHLHRISQTVTRGAPPLASKLFSPTHRGRPSATYETVGVAVVTPGRPAVADV